MSYKIPTDLNMLYSYVNMMLRDRYSSLEEFCIVNDVDMDAVIENLKAAGYLYNEEINQFR